MTRSDLCFHRLILVGVDRWTATEAEMERWLKQLQKVQAREDGGLDWSRGDKN